VKAGNPQFLKGERIGLKNIGVSFSESHRLQKIASIQKMRRVVAGERKTWR